MKRGVCSFAVIAGVTASLVWAQTPSITGRRDLADRSVVTKSAAYVLMPAELICGPEVEQILWSPLGRYLLVEHVVGRSEIPPAVGERRLSVYDRRSKRFDSVWKYPADIGAVDDVSWFPGTDVALVTVREETPASREGKLKPEEAGVYRLLRVAAASASARPVPGAETAAWVMTHMSSKEPYAIIHRELSQTTDGKSLPRAEWKSVVFAVRANGSTGPATETPSRGPSRVEWTDDGAPYLLHYRRGESSRGTAYALDLASGRVTQLAQVPTRKRRDPSSEPPRPDPGLQYYQSTISQGGVEKGMRPLWLETTDPTNRGRALISPDAAIPAHLSSKTDAVVYIEKRSAWLAPIVRVSLAAYEDLSREALLKDAKTIGTAISMYSQDYDDRFPLPERFAVGAVEPYVRDAATMQGFDYHYPGDTLKDIQNPGETAMGYLPGSGGRAVVYADGKARWVPNPK
jgi:hypothetical protein